MTEPRGGFAYIPKGDFLGFLKFISRLIPLLIADAFWVFFCVVDIIYQVYCVVVEARGSQVHYCSEVIF